MSTDAPRVFETADQVWAYLAERGETRDKHEHLWISWELNGLDDPWMGRGTLMVCNVPRCIAVSSVPRLRVQEDE